MASPTDLLQEAESLIGKTAINEAIDLLNRLVAFPVDEAPEGGREEAVRVKEQSILRLGEVLAKYGFAEELGELIQRARTIIDLFSKAKAAKLIRELVDLFLDMEATTGKEVSLCQQCIDWAKGENRVFLRQALEARLIALHVDTHNYTAALSIGAGLLRELKKIDDKALLVEVQLLESRAYQKLGNVTKARAALTSAKTTANAIYCPPKLQASLDMQSGILHGEEKDFKTGYSYFYEAFESFDSIENLQATLALKYMLLCKIMLNTPEDVQSIVSAKLALKYAGPQIEAMQNIAKASQDRSVAKFEMAVKEHHEYISEDPIVKFHLDALYDTLLEQNLLRIIEPFSRVEVEHVADIIKLPLVSTPGLVSSKTVWDQEERVEKKLSQMILDKTLHGILDQGQGVLIVFEGSTVDQTYTTTLETISSMGKVVDSMYSRLKTLNV